MNPVSTLLNTSQKRIEFRILNLKIRKSNTPILKWWIIFKFRTKSQTNTVVGRKKSNIWKFREWLSWQDNYSVINSFKKNKPPGLRPQQQQIAQSSHKLHKSQFQSASWQKSDFVFPLKSPGKSTNIIQLNQSEPVKDFCFFGVPKRLSDERLKSSLIAFTGYSLIA